MAEADARGRVDRVALLGALLASSGLLALPFAEYRSSRIGLPDYHGVAASGLLGFALVAVVAACAAVAVLVREPAKRAVVLKAGVLAGLALLAWAVGAAAVRLLAPAPPFARVSPGGGAWLALVGLAIVDFSARRALHDLALRRVLDALTLGAVAVALVLGGAARLSLVQEYRVNAEVFWVYALGHLALVGGALLAGMVVGVPLGVLATRNRRAQGLVLGVAGVIQTFPSLALLGLLVAPLAFVRETSPLLARLGVGGLGWAPAVLALTLYALLPIVRNTYVGLLSVDPGSVDAGRGMGMTRSQLLFRVQMPLALPLVLEGIRHAAVLDIGIATVTAFVGARSLGLFIFEGVGQVAPDLTLLGALPVIALALVADAALRTLRAAIVSPGLRTDAT